MKDFVRSYKPPPLKFLEMSYTNSATYKTYNKTSVYGNRYKCKSQSYFNCLPYGGLKWRGTEGG